MKNNVVLMIFCFLFLSMNSNTFGSGERSILLLGVDAGSPSDRNFHVVPRQDRLTLFPKGTRYDQGLFGQEEERSCDDDPEMLRENSDSSQSDDEEEQEKREDFGYGVGAGSGKELSVPDWWRHMMMPKGGALVVPGGQEQKSIKVLGDDLQLQTLTPDEHFAQVLNDISELDWYPENEGDEEAMAEDEDNILALVDAAPDKDVNRQSPSGYNVLISAAMVGSRYLVECFLDEGADPNRITLRGQTALDFAEKNGDKYMMAILKAKGGKTGSELYLKRGLSHLEAAIKKLEGKKGVQVSIDPRSVTVASSALQSNQRVIRKPAAKPQSRPLQSSVSLVTRQSSQEVALARRKQQEQEWRALRQKLVYDTENLTPDEITVLLDNRNNLTTVAERQAIHPYLPVRGRASGNRSRVVAGALAQESNNRSNRTLGNRSKRQQGELHQKKLLDRSEKKNRKAYPLEQECIEPLPENPGLTKKERIYLRTGVTPDQVDFTVLPRESSPADSEGKKPENKGELMMPESDLASGTLVLYKGGQGHRAGTSLPRESSPADLEGKSPESKGELMVSGSGIVPRIGVLPVDRIGHIAGVPFDVWKHINGSWSRRDKKLTGLHCVQNLPEGSELQAVYPNGCSVYRVPGKGLTTCWKKEWDKKKIEEAASHVFESRESQWTLEEDGCWVIQGWYHDSKKPRYNPRTDGVCIRIIFSEKNNFLPTVHPV